MLKLLANLDHRFGCSRRLARTMISSVVAAVGVASLTPAAQAQTAAPQASAQQGTGVAAAPFVRRLDTTPRMTGSETHPQPLAPLTGVDSATFAARKARAAHGLGDPKVASPPPARPQSLRTPNAAIVFNSTTEVGCGNVTPADQAIAVGDTTVGILQAINVCLNVFNKSGTLQAGYPKSLTSFVGLPPGTPITDPRAIYDWINHRYIVTFIQFNPSQTTASSYWIAVSTGDNPVGGYCLYNLGVQSVGPSGGFFPLPDFPRLGQDRQAIYLASNIFNTPTSYQWEEILVLPKAQMYTCAGFGFNFFANLTLGGVATDTTQPANVFAAGDDPRSEYLVTSENINFGGGQCSSGCNGLIVWALHSPLSSPTLTGTLIATSNNYSLPPNASQPGGSHDVDTGDTRISGMAMYNAGSIYASINATNGSTCRAILYQIQPFVTAGGANDGKIAGARILNEIIHSNTTFDTYYATQQPDTEGNVTYAWNFSNSGTFPSLIFSSRRAAQSVGTEPDGGIVAVLGAGFYGQGRWGDYTAVAPGGLASSGGSGSLPVMYFAGMFARSDGTWQTAIGRNGYSDISQQ